MAAHATVGYRNRNGVFCAVHAEDSWSIELVVGQSPAGKNVSTEAEGIVRVRHQATTDEETAY
jgi:hypothetical protein